MTWREEKNSFSWCQKSTVKYTATPKVETLIEKKINCAAERRRKRFLILMMGIPSVVDKLQNLSAIKWSMNACSLFRQVHWKFPCKRHSWAGTSSAVTNHLTFISDWWPMNACSSFRQANSKWTTYYYELQYVQEPTAGRKLLYHYRVHGPHAVVFCMFPCFPSAACTLDTAHWRLEHPQPMGGRAAWWATP